MKINQELVNRIVERAKKTTYGISDGLTHKSGQLSLDSYGGNENGGTPEHLALCLVNAYHAKYDLVSIFQATIEELLEENETLKDMVRQNLK